LTIIYYDNYSVMGRELYKFHKSFVLWVIRFILFYNILYYKSLQSEGLKLKSTLKSYRGSGNDEKLILIPFFTLVLHLVWEKS